jgi:ABC-type nitrate/sulfonate/bicarbonate transport system substrate-binding protein
MMHKGYPVDVMRVADYVVLASNGLLTNETTIANNPNLVRDMLQAVMRGITFTLEHSDEAYQICEDYVEGLASANQTVQKEIFNTSLEFWKTDRIGYSQPSSWENMQKVLLDIGMLTSPLDLSKAYTNDFVLSK